MPLNDKPSVLVVDDRLDKLLVIETLLAELPVEIVRATSGRAALRHVLSRDFALILLDVNMPGMDGFETAQLIRGRKQSEHIPIIFITAYSSEVFIEKGYSLGAVDYILQPVVAETLQAKVTVFVEMFRQKRALEAYARSQQQRAAQLQTLAAAAAAINAARSMEKMLQIVTDTARDLIAVHQAVTLYLADPGHIGAAQHAPFTSFSDAYAQWRTRNLQLGSLAMTALAHTRTAQRLSEEDLRNHSDWETIMRAGILTGRGMLIAPITRRDRGNHGVMCLTEKVEGAFTEDDEAMLTQLAQTAAIAIENAISFEAREANRAKDQFLAVLSHELRTPLTPVIAVLSSLKSDGRIPPDLQTDIEMIRRNVELESHLIDDLLDLTRISKGKVELHVDRVDAHFLLAEALAICQSEIAAKSLKVDVQLRATRYQVRADLTRFHQILWNLIKNAVKFTPHGGCIELASENPGEDILILRVSDTGIGIEPGMLPRIFNAFEQGERLITRQFGGLGLGLAISKALADAHGFMITAASAGRDRGATFTLTCPTIRARDPEKTVSETMYAPQPSPRLLKMLLVEDHIDTAIALARVLEREGHEVCVVPNAMKALNAYRERIFDLVISDIGLPDKSGLDLIRNIQSHRPVSAIALSGFGMEDDVCRSQEAGFHIHLTKPVNIAMLMECVHRISESESTPKDPVAPPVN